MSVAAQLPPSGLIFDLDGTLVDSLPGMLAATADALGEHGLPVPAESWLRANVGDSTRDLVRNAVAGAADVDAVHGAFRRHYRARLFERATLVPGVAELLDSLTAAGLRLAILSNKDQDLVDRVVVRLLARWPWRAIVGAGPGRPRKPDPAASWAVAALLDLAPERCALIGDARPDISAGLRAGMVSVGVSWGFHTPAQLREAGVTTIIDSPTQLPAALGLRLPTPALGPGARLSSHD